MKYSSIVPLVGGESIAIMNKLNGQMPEEVLSYSDFEPNDSHFINYIRGKGWTGDYVHLDEKKNHKPKKVDMVNTVCPCAGLSTLSPQSSADREVNNWMYETAEFVLDKIEPKVFWGENAPRLAQKTGKPVVEKLLKIGEKYGYTFVLLKTKSLVQGYSQIRDRTFYFFFKGDKAPLLPYVNRWPNERIETVITSGPRSEADPMNYIPNEHIPSQLPFYRYILEELHGGITHKEFYDTLEHSNNCFDYIEEYDSYDNLLPWLKEQGHPRHYGIIDRMNKKIKSGGNVMRRTTTWAKNYIGAFVGHLPVQTCHPYEDRYLTVRESMRIMHLPEDFNLINNSINHICQNVPVKTAEDMVENLLMYFDNRVDLIDTPYLLIDNKKRTYEFEKNSLQLTDFMI